MLRGALTRRGNRHLMIALTVALGACVATSMLSVMFNVGDKVNQELKSYGANIVVRPQGAAVLQDLYSTQGPAQQQAYLREDELVKIKTIFWTYNILDFAPLLPTTATGADGGAVTVTGTWFSHRLDLPLLGTAIYSAEQAILAGIAGCDFVAPYINRMENNAIDPYAVIASTRRYYDNHAIPCQIMGASFKNTQQILHALDAGAHTCTLPPDLLHAMLEKPLVEAAIRAFNADGGVGSA